MTCILSGIGAVDQDSVPESGQPFEGLEGIQREFVSAILQEVRPTRRIQIQRPIIRTKSPIRVVTYHPATNVQYAISRANAKQSPSTMKETRRIASIVLCLRACQNPDIGDRPVAH